MYEAENKIKKVNYSFFRNVTLPPLVVLAQRQHFYPKLF